jgi:biopolymer transport protein ExbD
MALLTERFTGEMNKTMYLKADQAVAYGRVVQIVNQCRKAGVEKIGLMAEKEKQ